MVIDEVAISFEEIREGMVEVARRYSPEKEAGPDAALEMGDTAKIAVAISVGGEPIPALTKNGTYLLVGYDSMPAGFVDGVVGMSVGEKREFDFEAPSRTARSDADLETHHASVSLLGIRRKAEVELTDEWVKANVRGVSGIDELFDRVASAFEAKARAQIERRVDAAVDEELVARLEVDLPESYVDAAVDAAERELRGALNSRGMTFSEYLEAKGFSEIEHERQVRERVGFEVRQVIALDALFDSRDFVLAEEDINDVLSMMLEGQESEIKRDYVLSGKMHLVEDAARRYKAHRWLVQTAKVTER